MGAGSLPAPDVVGVDLTDNDVFWGGVPHEYFAYLRRHDPVHWTPERGGRGFWSVTRYDDIVEVSRDFATYSSQVGATALEDLEQDALDARISMLDADPPLHTRLRRSVTHPFTRRTVSDYEDRIRQIVRDILDEALLQDEFDWMHDVAVRIPVRVLCEILGVPAEDEAYMVELSDRLMGNTDPDLSDLLFDSADTDDYRLLPFRSPAALEMHAYGRALADVRRGQPTDDLVSHLITGIQGRDPLQGRDFDAMFLLLVAAGNETTRSALGLGLLALIEHPDQWELLRHRGPEILDSATDELLRFTTPLHHFRRTATVDTTLAGQSIAAGDKVVVWYASGNRDESVFADPDELDLLRDPNPQLSFGRGGPHRCLGEHLARLEVKVTLEELLLRVHAIQRAGDIARVRSNFVHGLKSLPIRPIR